MIKINNKYLSCGAIIYLLISIFIFFIGWLKPIVCLFSSFCVLFSFYSVYQRIYKNDKTYIVLKKSHFLILTLAIFIWVIESGIGGTVYQHWDFHWRNALFRDLIDYSFPVIYPETNHMLCYYFMSWMVPALVGKIVGFSLAQWILIVWVSLGLCFVFLLLLEFCSRKFSSPSFSSSKLLLIFFLLLCWSGVDTLGSLFAQIFFGYNLYPGFGWARGFQFTSNIGLIEWVFHQSLPAWIITILFLQNYKRFDIYGFWGMILLPFAPLPFVGLFFLMIPLVLYYGKIYINNFSKKSLLCNIFSTSNLFSIIGILPIFFLFFSMNVASNGSANVGGFGINLALQKNFIPTFFFLIIFWIVEFLIYVAIIWKETEDRALLYSITISLLFIPFFRLGTGGDFCMRVSIPAFFSLMVLMLVWIFRQRECFVLDPRQKICCILLVCLGINAAFDIGYSLGEFRKNHFHAVVTEDVYSMADKFVKDNPNPVNNWINFITPISDQTPFVKYVLKEKSKKDRSIDLDKSIAWRKESRLYLLCGWYNISPSIDTEYNLSLNNSMNSVYISKTKCPVYLESIKGNSYHITLKGEKYLLDLPNNKPMEHALLQAYPQTDDLGKDNPAQRWSLLNTENGYAILYEKEWALTYNIMTNKVFLSRYTGDDSQHWIFTKI